MTYGAPLCRRLCRAQHARRFVVLKEGKKKKRSSIFLSFCLFLSSLEVRNSSLSKGKAHRNNNNRVYEANEKKEGKAQASYGTNGKT